MNKRNFTQIAAAASLAAGLAIAMTVPAQAQGGGGVSRSGTCSGTSTWQLKAKADDGQIEVEAEVDTNVNGQVWKWKIVDNGVLAANGKSTTAAPSGSFTVNRQIANAAGADRITLKASNAKTMETCKGTVTL